MATDTGRSAGQLYGRVLLRGSIRCLTGLHIGARSDDLAVGGIDEAVLRDPLTLRPYIPGSALRGKLRSLSEQAEGQEPNWETGGVHIHLCTRPPACAVCRLFGVPSQLETARPARLIVRDVYLSETARRPGRRCGPTSPSRKCAPRPPLTAARPPSRPAKSSWYRPAPCSPTWSWC